MPKVSKTANLHESTVKKAETHERTQRRTSKSTHRRTSNRNLPDTSHYTKVDERVLKTAKRLAKGNLKRIDIIDSTTVIVRNP